MRIALFLTPASDHHLRLAAQVGATELVAPYPGLNAADLEQQRNRAAAAGLNLSVIERHIPHHRLVHRLPGWEEQLEGFQTLIRNMGRAGVHTLCYNWMPDDDWQRTAVDVRERGGALVTEFDLDRVDAAPPATSTPADALWENFDAFLQAVLPVAEEAGVALALHPDDPPLPRLRGQDRILFSYAAFERAMALSDSPAHGICFCQGTFATAGEDIVAGIRRFASRIRFVHFRDIRGSATRFRETFLDNGQTDMAAAIRAYQEIDFLGPIRPDHVPTLSGESNAHPGYEMLGRLHAVGYIRGLLDGTAPAPKGN